MWLKLLLTSAEGGLMATPLAHAAAGIASFTLVRLAMPLPIGATARGLKLLAMGAACLPDLDLAVSWLLSGNMMRWHSGPSHSLAFALLCVVVSALLTTGRLRVAIAAIVGMAVTSHVVIDLITGPHWGLHQSFGVPALWPWIDERITSPFTIFRGVRHGGDLLWLSHHNLATAASELVFAIPLFIISLLLLRRNCST